MQAQRRIKSSTLALAVAASGIWWCPVVSPAQPLPQPTFLPQGWSDTNRQWFYTTTQGSQLMDYGWFLALERPNSQQPFLDDGLARFGYLANPASSQNPNGLPVGFVADTVDKNKYVGMTCAACHTGQVEYGGTLMQIDGAPCQATLDGFLHELRDSVQETNTDGAKFARFAGKVLAGHDTPRKRKALHTALDGYADIFTPFVSQSTPDAAHRWGPTRADAFGMIFNRVSGYDLPYNPNYRVAAAPVSYPFLWGTPWHDKVQWNGSAPNTNVVERLARNVGEVLGVFASVDLKKPGEVFRYYKSSATRLNLIDLEERLTTLRAPQWPEQYLGTPDATLVQQGATVYADRCASCHAPFNPAQPTQIKVFMDPLDEVKTDPAMVMAPLQRMAKTRQLAGTKIYMYFGDPLKHDDLVFNLVTNAVAGAILWPGIGKPPKPRDTNPDDRPTLRAALFISGKPKAQRTPEEEELLHNLLFQTTTHGQRSAQSQAAGPAYKARPLDGIWATAPYLHNGSVPTLWELMKPEDERIQKFYVGSPKFDPVNVGLNTQVQTDFFFDTTQPGNLNTGHSGSRYGTDLSDDQKRALVEYMKTL